MSDNKVELFRQSKGPIEIEDFVKYQKEWTNFYDKLMKRYGTNIEHMERIETLLNKKEAALTKKYNTPVWIALPQTTAEFTELCTKYGSPIMIAQRMDGNGLVAIIMDAMT